MFGGQDETPEQTLDRLRRGQVASAGPPDDDPAHVFSPAAAYEFPVPKVNPVATYQVFTRGWAPDALVLLHPELFAARMPTDDAEIAQIVPAPQVQVEVAVFALAAAGLIRLWVRRPPLGIMNRFAVVVDPVDGMTADDILPLGRPAWVSDLILAKVYSAGRLPIWGRSSLRGLQGRSARAAAASGMVRDGQPDPRAREASGTAARALSHRWTVFITDYSRLHLSLRRARILPSRPPGG